ncbi:hypothetical protein ABPG75_007018 [Micractinium tetrahymenae]
MLAGWVLLRRLIVQQQRRQWQRGLQRWEPCCSQLAQPPALGIGQLANSRCNSSPLPQPELFKNGGVEHSGACHSLPLPAPRQSHLQLGASASLLACRGRAEVC